jgi:sigma-54 dependent transcriptional regulator, acetoin dehydrogenase operon transcriptional activator AcoR
MAPRIVRSSQTNLDWLRFCSGGVTEGVRDCIGASWLRSREYGLNPNGGSSEVSVSIPVRAHDRTPKNVKQMVDSHYVAIESSLDVPFALLLIDSNFKILHTCGNEKMLERFSDYSVREGGTADERFCGTNAPALSLIENKPVAVSAEEHFLKDFHWARCLALPVFDFQQRVAGSLCMATDVEFQWTIDILSEYLYGIAHSLAFHMFIDEKARRLEIQESYFSSTVEHTDDALLLVNVRGDVMALNWAAQGILGLPSSKVCSKNILELIEIHQKDLSLSRLTRRPEFVNICAPANGRTVFSMDAILLTAPVNDKLAYILRLVPGKSFTYTGSNSTSTAAETALHVVANTPETSDLLYQAKRAAKTSSSVLIEGETGTGKELLARAIHHASPRRSRAFVAVNCAAIPYELIESEFFGYERGAYTGAKKEGAAGRFELANGGTIFLDEIQAMPSVAQTKLLRVLQERAVTRLGGASPIMLDFRVVAASSVNLLERVEKGEFVDALYYRLNVVKLMIPPLRERTKEIVALTDAFIQEMNRQFGRSIKGVSRDVLKIFERYDWPGNVRELRNCIEYAFNFCDGELVSPGDLGGKLTDLTKKSKRQARTIEGVTRKLMMECLDNFPTAAASATHLGISVSTFYRKMKKFGLSK